MELAEFGALFERFERSAFRIEARDHYDVDDERERFAAFLEGRPALPRTPEDAAWLALVAASRAAGRVIERVRIVSEPLTDFWLFDDELVVLLSYDDKCRFLAVHQPSDTRPYIAAKQRALSFAVDFEDFVTAREP